MKQIKYCLLAIVLTMMASCDYIANFNKPTLELSEAPPYELKISNFSWGYGVVTINQFNGDFDRLDEKVYNLLKGKTGTCKVNMQSTAKYRYGKPDLTISYIGDINIDELNKYQDWKYWQRESGIRKLLYSRFVSPQMDSVKTETITPSQALVDTTSRATSYQPISSNKVYGFSSSMLYPLEADRNRFDSNQFIVDGIITEVNFGGGAMRIKTDGGEDIDVQFYPLDASSAVQNDLRLAIKVGNKINSVCARAGASTMDLISAEITER
jgi:hypothetical protein